MEISEIWLEPVDPTPLVSSTFTPTPDDNETQFFTPTWTSTPSPSPTATPVDPELYYYYFNDTIYLTPSKKVVGLYFSAETTQEEAERFIGEHPDLESFLYPDLWPSDYPCRIDLNREIDWVELKVLLDLWAQDSRVDYVSPTFEVYCSPSIINYEAITDSFIVKFLPHVSEEEIDALNHAHGIEVIEPPGDSERHKNRYVLKPMEFNNTLQILHEANVYQETGLAEYSVPSFQGGVCLFSYTARSHSLQGEGINNTSAVDGDPNQESLLSQEPSPYYYYFNEKRTLSHSTRRIAICFREDAGKMDLSNFLLDHSYLESIIDDRPLASGQVRFQMHRSLSWGDITTILEICAEDPTVYYVSPVFEFPGNVEETLIDIFVVKFKAGVSQSTIEAFNSANEALVVQSGGRFHRHERRYVLRPKHFSNSLQMLELANRYQESAL